MAINVRLPIAVCVAAGKLLQGRSHASLEALFKMAGAPGEPPQTSHAEKWKQWLFQSGLDSNTDSLGVLGTVVEEALDIEAGDDEFLTWANKREEFIKVLEEYGFRYYRGGQVLPVDAKPPSVTQSQEPAQDVADGAPPSDIMQLLNTLIKGLPRAMHPLVHRRKNAQPLSFGIESDLQDLLHAMLRPWIRNIKPEDYTPSYASRSTRMDFLISDHKLVLEIKRVRDRSHGQMIGDELIVDIEHYCAHPACEKLWCIVYDLENCLTNAQGLVTDLEGTRAIKGKEIEVRVTVISP